MEERCFVLDGALIHPRQEKPPEIWGLGISGSRYATVGHHSSCWALVRTHDCYTGQTVLDQELRSDRPRYCVTTPIRAGTYLWPWLWPWPSVPAELWSWSTHKISQVQSSVGSKDRVETNGRTDRRTLLIALTSRLTRSVTRYVWFCHRRSNFRCCVQCQHSPDLALPHQRRPVQERYMRLIDKNRLRDVASNNRMTDT